MSDCQHESDLRSLHPPDMDEPCNDVVFAQVPPTGPGAPLDLGRLAEALPRLGVVLWLERRERRARSAHATIGVRGVLLVDHPALRAFARCSTVSAHSAVTPQGPREWICLRDHAGEAQAKMFLLPDTDYLAWDEMTGANAITAPSAPAQRWHAHTAFLRSAFARFGTGWHARLLVFDLKHLPWLRTLGARPPLRISLIGLEIARSIARAEGADLVTPLHTA
jgi:hypothetical protein